MAPRRFSNEDSKHRVKLLGPRSRHLTRAAAADECHRRGLGFADFIGVGRKRLSRVHGRHGGRDHAAAAQGIPRQDVLHHQEVSAFVVGAVALITAPFAVPPASFAHDIGRAVAKRAEHDGGHGRGEAEAAGGEVGPRGGGEDVEVKEEHGHREGGAARRGAAGGEEKSVCEREEGKESVMTWPR
uniref:Uncharacterized protein n=1 Tax=Oryza rufipogon TaxID=4529 RepID=A0A0E0QZW8_ORYRU